MNAPRQRAIVGTAVSMTDYEAVLDFVDASIAEDARTYVCFAPASTLMFARNDPRLAEALAEADIVAPDGMGVVYAARMLGETIQDRVYGPDFMLMQLARAERSGVPTYLYGGFDSDALDRLTKALRSRFPGLVVAGQESPPHHVPDESELAATAAAINASGAKTVWVGLGSPKQELWMRAMRRRLDAPVLLGVGAAFDFHAGRTAQAPAWMQKRGLEWLHRVGREPLRLGRRYLATLPHFVLLVLRQRFTGG